MRAAITGIGIVAPNGLGAVEYWTRTLGADSGIGPITRFDARPYPVRLAGEIADFAAHDHLPGRLLPQSDRMTQLALTAAGWALADAGLVPAELGPFDVGVCTANSSGGFEFGQRELENLWARGPRHVSAYQSFAWFYAVNTGQISIRHGVRGPSGVTVTEGAGGLDTIAQARRQLRRGTPVMVTGGIDSALCPWGLVAHLSSGRLSTRTAPDDAYLPFDERACGHVIGEGGAILIIEDLDNRHRAPERWYGEVAGYCATFDPAPWTGRPRRLADAIRGALDDAAQVPADVDLVLADAAGVPELDLAEAAALTEVFGPFGVAVTATKTMTGRLNSGGAALDVASALLSIRDGVIPPTINVRTLARGCELDLVTRRRRARVRCALVVARGFGGFNSALVVRSPDYRANIGGEGED